MQRKLCLSCPQFDWDKKQHPSFDRCCSVRLFFISWRTEERDGLLWDRTDESTVLKNCWFTRAFAYYRKRCPTGCPLSFERYISICVLADPHFHRRFFPNDVIVRINGATVRIKTVGDLRKLFLIQLSELFVQGFNILLESGKFIYGFLFISIVSYSYLPKMWSLLLAPLVRCQFKI